MENKKVYMDGVDWDGNVYGILAGFIRAATKQGWSKPEVDQVIDEAISEGYDKLIRVMKSFIVNIQEVPNWHPITKVDLVWNKTN